MKITNEQIQETYIQGKRVHSNEISLKEASNIIAEATGMKEGSAHVYVNTFIKIMLGTGYKRTINSYGVDYYLKNIKKDFDIEILLTAIASIKKHLEYYEGVGKSSQPKIHNILKKYTQEMALSPIFNEISNNLRSQTLLSSLDSSETRKSRLKVAVKKPQELEVITKVYIRNPDVVAETLNRANGICEKCNHPAPFKRAKDNTPYLEVHHKIHLANGGYDTIENTLALCPNCHRELHYGSENT
ncbi:5-methylcytosine-specific restriction enzyme A [Bathymodiolus thermophilus thioautotrophic gill symbiont]|uniref:HNH nuclease domain-containing protein n=1 Tax=Bathymodiolus thermophilus thioautotrophic gill symbiont TaxID=2360 RepID=A0A8H9CG80_9GAMM|nr:HNH endonuclease signature motif containing protein [Bathymodiolus thermophilus thioautotrophic gill symbiont]CAB5502903.1 hypothetical protein THERMOS_1691 [Bathymodiolus thermophilus thioautotrophic gill symbiont]SHA22933.1 5-methylcytosine-specific restriction enzyme A [Bathymodiolus thermophilus thioautotrophic gill symbiont]